MSFERFDDVARRLASGASRRSVVRTLGAVIGVGGIAVTGRGAQASIEDILNGDDEDEDEEKEEQVCRRGCLRRCRRERQRCFLRRRNIFRCQRIDCQDRCCEDDDD
jgi:hypothetical protein